ncbi:MAG: hypothetical protein ACOX87_10140 [Chloroflexota bacterium]
MVAKPAQISKPAVRLLHFSRENAALFVCFLAIYALAAYYIAVVLKLYHNDTIARTALGYFTLYGRDPHLASVGFIWTPLVSLLQVPMFPLFRVIGEPAFAGPILGVIFGAAAVPMLNETGRSLNVERSTRFLVVLLFGLHPTILLYAATGMSETVFFFFMVASIYYILRWATKQAGYTAIVISATCIALSFWVRYEAIPLLLSACLTVLVVIFSWYGQHSRTFRESLEATWITVMLPAVYSVFIWIFFNWLIMNDPFYWLSGEYSNIAFTYEFRGDTNPLYQNLPGAIAYSLLRVVIQFVAFPALVIATFWLSYRRKSLMPTAAIWVSIVLVAFHIYQNYTGASYGWYRFFTYCIPASIPAFFWLLYSIKDNDTWVKTAVIVMIAGMAVSIVTTTIGMADPAIGKEESSFVQAIATGGTAPQSESRNWAVSRTVARYIADNDIDGPILLDTFQGFAIVLFAEHPEQFVKTQDLDFRDAVRNPREHGIAWVLVPRPDENLYRNEWILKSYPSIWEEGVPWAQLVENFGDWKLFRVIP